MEDNIDEKPMTIKDFRDVMIPAMEEVFATKKDLNKFATKEDLSGFATSQELGELKQEVGGLRGELAQFKNESLVNQDKILKDLDILITEKEMGYFQKQKE